MSTQISNDEMALIQEMQTLLKTQLKKDYKPGNFKRDAHPKTLALLQAEFIVEPGLLPNLQVGIFRKPGTYPAWVRISNAYRLAQSDKFKDLRGFAIKIDISQLERKRERERERESYLSKASPPTQDFVLLSTPTIPIGTLKLFRDAIYYTIRWNLLVFLGKMILTGHWNIFSSLRRKKNDTSPLDIRFWSVTPYMFGDLNVVKYTLIPTSTYRSVLPTLLTDNYLTDNIEKHLNQTQATFDFMVQFQEDPEKMPIEDASIEWKEKDAPFFKVATLKIPMQQFRTKERDQLAEALSFSPENALLTHKPLGGLNRARMVIYKNLAQFRQNENKL